MNEMIETLGLAPVRWSAWLGVLRVAWCVTFIAWCVVLVLWVRAILKYNKAYREYQECRRQNHNGPSEPVESSGETDKPVRLTLKLLRRCRLIIGDADFQSRPRHLVVMGAVGLSGDSVDKRLNVSGGSVQKPSLSFFSLRRKISGFLWCHTPNDPSSPTNTRTEKPDNKGYVK